MKELFIEWHGEILAQVGYGLQARRILKPLREAGVKIKLLQKEDYVPKERRIDDPYWMKWLEESASMPDAPIRICYELPSLATFRDGAANVCYCMWETDKYPSAWVPIINSGKAFFAGCKELEKSAKKAGIVIPIYSVTPPIDHEMWCPTGPKIDVDGIPEGSVVFAIIASWIPRKNFNDLVVGFCCAFDKVKDACLVIKTWGGNNDTEFKNQLHDNIRARLSGIENIKKPKIMILSDMLPEEQTVKLLRGFDVYVNIAHGEGFDLPMVQAMSMGKIGVAMPYLGHAEYMNEENSLLVDYNMTPVIDAKAPGYTSDQMWARPVMTSFMSQLRTAYDLVKSNSQEYLDMKEQASKTIAKMFDEKVTTKHFISILRKVSKGIEEPQVVTK